MFATAALVIGLPAAGAGLCLLLHEAVAEYGRPAAVAAAGLGTVWARHLGRRLQDRAGQMLDDYWTPRPDGERVDR